MREWAGKTSRAARGASVTETPVVIVTGAAGGLGAETVRLLASRSAAVLAADVDERMLAALVDHVEGPGAVAAHEADVSQPDEVRGLVDEAVRRFGRLDALFNNAGILGPSAPIEEYAESDFARVLAVNVQGIWLGMKYALPHLASTRGRIVNTSSIAGITGWTNLSGYTAAKHAVIGLTRAAALECADRGVQVNALCPGSMDTAMFWEGAEAVSADRAEAQRILESAIPLGRLGSPAEVARAAVWLLLDVPPFMTGAIVPVDGGQTVG